MADDSDTFSSDDNTPDVNVGKSGQGTPVSALTTFIDKSNNIVQFPSRFDPGTGKDLLIDEVKQKIPDLTPIKVMQDKQGNQVPIPYDRIKEFVDLGLKPVEQVQAEQSAQQSKQNLLSGKIPGYIPSKSTSYLAGLGESSSSGLEPQAVGAYEGLKSLATGGDFTPAYQQGRDIEVGLNKAAQNTNPKSYLGGQVSGGVMQALGGNAAQLGAKTALTGVQPLSSAIDTIASKIPFQSFGKQAVGQGIQGAVSSGMEAENQGQNDVGAQALKGAEYGGLGAIGGQALGELGSLGVKGLNSGLNAAIAPEARTTLSQGLKNIDYSSPAVQEPLLNKAAGNQKLFENTIDDIRSTIGSQKNDLLNSIESVDHSPLKDNFQKNLDLLDDLKNKTGDPERLNAISQAQDKLKGAIKTLDLNPNSASSVDEVKQDLAAPLFDTKGNFISKSGNTNINGIQSILGNSRQNAQLFLEDYLPNDLKGTNKAYQTILRAQNPQEAYDAVIPTMDDMNSLIKGNMSLGLRNKINNLHDLNSEVQQSSVLPQETKSNMQDLTDSFLNTAKQASLAQKVQNASGVMPNASNQAKWGAKIGTYLSPQNNVLTSAAEDVYNGIPKNIYDNLPTSIQNVVKSSPSFAAQLMRSLPQTAGNDVRDFRQGL